jgi:hypothetical protein
MAPSSADSIRHMRGFPREAFRSNRRGLTIRGRGAPVGERVAREFAQGHWNIRALIASGLRRTLPQQRPVPFTRAQWNLIKPACA